MSIESEVLDRISPDPEFRSRINGTVESIMRNIRSNAEELALDVGVLLVGSVAKDTYLVSTDIDLFVLFSKDLPRDLLEQRGLELGKRVIEGEEKYAEHPYVHGEFQGFDVDVVPCYDLEDASELKSAVDRTPFHMRYVVENLKPEQRNEVRLLKQFTKGVGVYGAEARVEGFSGYLTELLVMRYGDFRSVLESASGWIRGTTLWLEERGKTRFNDPLIFYDPIDLGRNVASALSVDSFALFIQACSEYLHSERIDFFFPREREPLSDDEIMWSISERGTSVVVAAFDRPDIIDDNLFPQARKTLEGLMNLLDEFDFVVVDSAFLVDDRVYFVFELENEVLPRCRRHVGPPVWMEHSERFLEKWATAGMSAPFIKGGRWIVLVQRKFPNALDLLESRVERTALGNEFKDLAGYIVAGGEEIFDSIYHGALSALIDKRKNWEV